MLILLQNLWNASMPYQYSYTPKLLNKKSWKWEKLFLPTSIVCIQNNLTSVTDPPRTNLLLSCYWKSRAVSHVIICRDIDKYLGLVMEVGKKFIARGVAWKCSLSFLVIYGIVELWYVSQFIISWMSVDWFKGNISSLVLCYVQLINKCRLYDLFSCVDS